MYTCHVNVFTKVLSRGHTDLKTCLNFQCLEFHIIGLFINSDAILNRDALWPIQGKNHHVNAAIVRGIRRTGKILR